MNELAAGTVLQETYRIVGPFAEGGCGEIYLADHLRLPGQVAIKVLHRGLLRNEEALSRFRQEAEITATLRHPHIVQVLDFNVTELGHPYLVMELLEGMSLAQRIAETGAFAPAAVLNIVDQIAQALHVAHLRGIVHRDLKPDNIMLLAAEGMQDFVKVLDFGISQASWQPRLTDNSARVAGTPQYMSPEQACGQRDAIDSRSDQFSLAAIAYTLLTGREPFEAQDPIAVLYQVVHAEPLPPTALVPWLGSAVDAVILRGLAKQSNDRFPSVLAFVAALKQAIACAPSLPPEAVPQPGPPRVRKVEPDPDAPTLTFNSGVVSVGAVISPTPVGHPTQKLIRQMRRRMYRLPRRLALLAVTGAALAFGWMSPMARATAQGMWRQAHAQVQRLTISLIP